MAQQREIIMIEMHQFITQMYAEKYLPGIDWRLISAQLMQESGFDPEALSPAGAQGIAQFMPATWEQVAQELKFPDHASPMMPSFAIHACCYYMSKLLGKWTAPRPDMDRYALTLASYNAGFGNLIAAQKLADGANDYHSIINKLDRVTGFENARQTRGYVDRIFRYYVKLVVNGTF